MPRICTICTHSDRNKIDQQLVEGIAFPAIAALFRVSADALGRHKANHLPAQLAEARGAEIASQADDLLSKIANLEVDAQSIYEQAKRKGDLKMALAAVRELTRVIELLAKIKGELDERTQININNQASNAAGIVGLPKWEDSDKIVQESLKQRFHPPAQEIEGELIDTVAKDTS